jgi:hypothetical protein
MKALFEAITEHFAEVLLNLHQLTPSGEWIF